MDLPSGEHGLTVRNLLLALLGTFSSGWVPASHFERMAREFGVPDGAPAIYFLTGLSQIIREMPIKVFDDVTARSALLDSLQAALDATIEREEMREEKAIQPNEK